MAQVYKFSEEEIEEIVQARRENKDKRVETRLKALEMRARNVKASKIAEVTGFHSAYISQLAAKYKNGGIEAITGNHYGGNRRNMSVEEEAAILAPFRKRAAKGEMIEIKEIKAAYQAAVDHPISIAQIYYVLHRHGWRKVMPRSRHPKKADDATNEASKKLSPESKN